MILVWNLTKLPVVNNFHFVMEGSTLDLLEDAEDLMFDTRKRLGSCVDLEASLEIRGEDLTLAKKNMKEFEKINAELMVTRKIRQNTPEMQCIFEEVTNDYLILEPKVKDMTKVIFGLFLELRLLKDI